MMMVILVKLCQTEITVAICPKSLSRTTSKILLMKIDENIIKIPMNYANLPLFVNK